MKMLIFAVTLIATATSASAQGYGTYGTGYNSSGHGVSGHVTSNGTYVPPHQATNPNSTDGQLRLARQRQSV